MWQLRQPAPAVFDSLDVAAPNAEEVGPDQVLMRFLAGSICGSDIPKFMGHVDPDNPYTGLPGVPLHEFVGLVEASRSERFVPGDRVVGIVAQSRGLAEYVINPDHFVHRVDDRLTDTQATVVQPVSTVLSAYSSMRDVAGQRVAVLGLGPLGMLFAQVAKANGAAHVTGVDRVDRAEVAAAFGIDEVVTSEVRAWATSLDDSLPRPDLVIDAIGHRQEIVSDAVEAVTFGGEVLVFGLPEDNYVFPMRAFFRKNLTMWAGATQDWQRFLSEAQDHVLKYDVLRDAYITHTMSISEAARAYRLYATPAPGRLKVALTPPE
ncbi:zinc-binding dehydrogenase [Nocardioidaceae bacterium SCSIO 66511]|nr:zinc-binding dehydrogenase [Nocardioidaceae bacterium SCSIO 66511]